MRAGINALTAAFLVGVVAGLALTPDGRAWMRQPSLLLGAPAEAAPAPAAPTIPPAPAPTLAPVTPLPARLAKGPLRVGVFGDSMADGLYAGLYRQLRDEPRVTVRQFSAVSTGLSRYDYVDIEAKTRAQLDEQPVDVAIVLFGTNDAQGVSLDGAIHPFGSEPWKAAYAQRIDGLVALLRSRDVAIYWVGLPRMKSARFDAEMATINAVVETRMRALGVPFIETVSVTSDGEGAYAAYLPNEVGRRTLMRADDGVHMTPTGYRRFSAPVAARLRRDARLDAPVARPF